MEAGESRFRWGGGLSPTLTAEMGGHGNNYVYVAIDGDDSQKADERGRTTQKDMVHRGTMPDASDSDGGILRDEDNL